IMVAVSCSRFPCLFVFRIARSVGSLLFPYTTLFRSCPTCNGTGKITASILVSDQIEKYIEHLITKQNERYLLLALHPYLYAYFTHGLISIRMRWYFKYKRWLRMEKDSSLAITEFKFLNREGEEIQLA